MTTQTKINSKQNIVIEYDTQTIQFPTVELENTALYHALCNDNIDTNNAKLSLNAIRMRDSELNTLLHVFTKLNNYKAVQFLIENNADLYAKNMYGETPLIIALKNDYTDIRCLLRQTAYDRILKANTLK